MSDISALRGHTTIAILIAAFGHPWWALVSLAVALVTFAMEPR